MSTSLKTDLKISCATDVNDKMIEDLKTATNLKKIIFTYSEKSINELVSSLTSNEYLHETLEEIEYSYYHDCDYNFSAICDYVKKCKNIKNINFSNVQISSDNLIKLADITKKCTTLRSLNLDNIYDPKTNSSFSHLLDSIMDNIHIQ